MSMFKFFCCGSNNKEDEIPKKMQKYWNESLGVIINSIRIDFKNINLGLYEEKVDLSEEKSIGLLEASKNYLALCEEINRVQHTGINEILTRLAHKPEQLNTIYALWKADKKVEAIILLLKYGKNILQEEEAPIPSVSLSLS